jgi:hypothetical protein
LELPSAEPLPTAQAVSDEEMAILWREVGRLPEIYREPLILFYRDHKSVGHVAEALELTPDVVMQRLTRGRRQLQERMLEFVESTLQRTNPGPQFTLQVQAAIPLLVGAGPVVAVGTAAKGGAAAKSGMLSFLLAWAAPFVGLFAAIGMSWAEISQAATKRERRFAVRWTLVLWLSVLGFLAAMYRCNQKGSVLKFQTAWLPYGTIKSCGQAGRRRTKNARGAGGGPFTLRRPTIHQRKNLFL